MLPSNESTYTANVEYVPMDLMKSSHDIPKGGILESRQFHVEDTEKI